MLKEDVCRGCRIGKTCPQQNYSSGENEHAGNYFNCMYFTCNMTGKPAANDAIRDGRFERIEVAGETVSAVRFGTQQKPTGIPGREFERFVAKNGDIIVKTSDGEYRHSGQNSNKLS